MTLEITSQLASIVGALASVAVLAIMIYDSRR